MMFKSLKGIEKEREETKRHNNLDYMIASCDTILAEFENIEIWNINKGWAYQGIRKEELYNKIFERTSQLLEDTDFNENDLTGFVLAKANKHHHQINKRVIAGLYSGCLLHLLTKRNRAKGENTKFYINGQGKRFDCLFSHARQIDELVLENLQGDNICEYVGTHDYPMYKEHAKAGTVVLLDIEGDNALKFAGGRNGSIACAIGINIRGKNALKHIAGDEGNAGIVIGREIKGDHALNCISHNFGRTKMIIGKDIEGDEALSYIHSQNYAGLVLGRDIKGHNAMTHLAGESGKIGMAIGKNIKGDYAMGWTSCDNGRTCQVFALDIEGDNALALSTLRGHAGAFIANRIKGDLAFNEFSYLHPGEEYYDFIIALNLEGKNHFQDAYKRKGKVLYPKNKKYSARDWITRIRAERKYNKSMEKYKINEILELAKTMEGKNWKELIDISKEINKIYIEVADFDELKCLVKKDV